MPQPKTATPQPAQTSTPEREGRIRRVLLGDVASIYSGGTPSRKNPDYWGGGIPWIKTKLINYNLITREIIDEFITENGLKNSSARYAPEGSILMALIGQGKTRGQVGILKCDATISQNCACISPGHRLHNIYLYHYLAYNYNTIRGGSNYGGLGNLNSGLLKTLLIPLPPLETQRKIAAILGTWDRAITAAQRLLELKRERRNWLLEHLLETSSGNVVRLGDIVTISSAGIDKKIVDHEERVRLVNYMDVYRRCKLYNNETYQIVTSSIGKALKCTVIKGDILVTPSSEKQIDIGHTSVAMTNIDSGVYSYHIYRMRPKAEIDLQYSAYFLKSQRYYRQAAALAKGSGQRYVISKSDFAKIKVKLHSKDNQIVIGNMLSRCHKEEGYLSKFIQLLQTQKRGLMHKLLSGEWEPSS